MPDCSRCGDNLDSKDVIIYVSSSEFNQIKKRAMVHAVRLKGNKKLPREFGGEVEKLTTEMNPLVTAVKRMDEGEIDSLLELTKLDLDDKINRINDRIQNVKNDKELEIQLREKHESIKRRRGELANRIGSNDDLSLSNDIEIEIDERYSQIDGNVNDDSNVVGRYIKEIEVELDGTGLVCQDCLIDNDNIVWQR